MSLLLTECDPKSICLRINERSPEGGLFEGDRSRLHPDSRLPWRISPEPFWLTAEQLAFLEALGPALLEFQRAANLLYHQSVKGLQPSWVHRYLDAGKPERIVDFGRMNRIRSHLPLVMRPDLILTAHGVRLTELDSVPGGIGFTASISSLYTEVGYDIIGGGDGLVDGFYEAICASVEVETPVVAILVSDESDSYRVEMAWLADTLRQRGRPVYCLHPRDINVDDDGLLVQDESGSLRRADVVYRFFELFDLPNISKAELITYFAKKNAVRLTPPLKAYLEEKMWLALFHHAALERFWERELKRDTRETLADLIPRTWVLDPAPMPPHAVIAGLRIGCRPVSDWSQLDHLTKKERELIVKPSGFGELASESRGVVVGHDVPESAWAGALQNALAQFDQGPYILQEFHKAARLPARYYDFFADDIREMHGRVLLRPYYYIDGDDVRLSGIQAIVCPSDKKVLHGMTDAVLVPCAVREDEDAPPGPAA